MARRASKRPRPTQIRVGDRIRFEFAGRITVGEVIEDRVASAWAENACCAYALGFQ
jgi:hypothetical protein